MAKKPILLKSGDKYGRLTVIRFSHIQNRAYHWICKCECGEERAFVGFRVASGTTRSCGCFQREAHHKTHGMTDTSEYKAWESMISRCYRLSSSTYSNYGGRGITVCASWLDSFENFFSDMGKKPGPEYSIDRINNEGNYEPGNCRWATRSQQMKNRRKWKVNKEKKNDLHRF